MTGGEKGEIDSVLEGLSDFVRSVVVPLENANAELLDNPRTCYDERGAKSPEVRALLKEVRTRAAEAGFYSMFVPESAGGAGCGRELLYRSWEHLYATCGPARPLPYVTVAHWSYGPSALCAHLSPELASGMLDDLMSGRITTCFGMSEPDAGSDAWAMRTTAKDTDSGWVISGVKQWITNAPTADWVFVFAVTDEELRRQRRGGVSCFLIPIDTPGVAVDSVIKLFGHVGGDEGIISFDNVEVPRSALVGELHRGFALAMLGVSTGRLYNAGRCVGLARWALDRASEYADQRSTFGSPISSYQGISFQLADCAVDIYAGDVMARDCARRFDCGERADHELSMVKLYTTEMCTRVYDRCMQVHGGMGLTSEMRLFDGWQQARIVRIADGSAEIMRRNIAKGLAKRRTRPL
jgi:acyl-CoA dehydrogenase